MYTTNEYEKLSMEYGPCSSWAIWDENDQNDTSVIDESVAQLNTRYVFVGLNISKDLKKPSWSNFHGGQHDRKLMYACNNDTKLRGSYLTDIFKYHANANAREVESYFHKHPEKIKKHADLFEKEMMDVKIGKDTVFITLGADTSFLWRCFNEHFRDRIRCGKVVNIRHYASRGTDEAWVNCLGKKLGIKKIEKWRKGKLK